MRNLFIIFLLLSISIKGQDLTIKSGINIIVKKTSYIKVPGNFSNTANGTVTLNSDSDEFSSIIVGGTAQEILFTIDM